MNQLKTVLLLGILSAIRRGSSSVVSSVPAVM